jgi:hypothetical protein
VTTMPYQPGDRLKSENALNQHGTLAFTIVQDDCYTLTAKQLALHEKRTFYLLAPGACSGALPTKYSSSNIIITYT